MDGCGWYASAEVTRLVCQYENTFKQGTISFLPNTDSDYIVSINKDNKTLVAMINDTADEIDRQIVFPSSLGNGIEFYSGTHVNGGQTINCKLESGDIAVYVF